MMVFAVTIFYDELPRMMEGVAESAARAGAVLLVAVDGRYADFPGTGFLSPASNREALVRFGERCRGMDVRVLTPDAAWPDQVAKRCAAHAAVAQAGATAEDWTLILDADERIPRVETIGEPPLAERLAAFLAGVTANAIDVPWIGGRSQTKRALLRCVPGLRLGHDHAHYVYDGGVLNGAGMEASHPHVAPFTIINEPHLRWWERDEARARYYRDRRRRRTDIERPRSCSRCGSPCRLLVERYTMVELCRSCVADEEGNAA